MSKITFQRGPRNKKYTAITPDGKMVHFGDRRFEQFHDRTPLHLYSHLDHNNTARRINYRRRHRAILLKNGEPAYKKKYSPAWFSYYYLW